MLFNSFLPIISSAIKVATNITEVVLTAPETAVNSVGTVVNNTVNLITENPLTTISNDIATMITGPTVIQEAIGIELQGVHAVAEGLLASIGLQPIFSLIDEPLIHPLLWEPLGNLTNVPVEQHPTELTSATSLLDQILEGPVIVQEGIGTMLEGLHGIAEGILATTGLQPIFSVIDEPIIHPLFWEPLGILTNTPVATHPDSLADATQATLPDLFSDLLQQAVIPYV
ncbi:hypothetical protein ACEN3H_14840 [Acinetobacter lactucae]|uniref:hypothetical protein n=1 Tax=Acinetobacter lactucae TaxID=1785128 RepID=UPI00358DD5FA